MAGSQSGAGEDQATQVFPTEVVAHQVPTQVVPQHPPTEVATPSPPAQIAPTHPPTEVAAPGPPAADPAAQAAPALEPTVTAPPGQAAGPADQAAPRAPLSPAAGAMPPSPVAGIVRYGPGVPVELPVSQGGRTAEHVWSGDPPPAPPRRSARLRRFGGIGLTVI